MTQDSFIVEWLQSLDASSAKEVEERYTKYRGAMVAWAKKISQNCPPGAIDAESIADSVFASLLNGVREGRLQSVADHDELWWLLLEWTRRKFTEKIRRNTAKKRGGGIRPLSIQGVTDSQPPKETYIQLTGHEPSPEYLAETEEQFRYLLSLLRDEQIRRIAVDRIGGHTIDEIAEKFGVSTSTVDRKLRVIRATWRSEFEL